MNKGLLACFIAIGLIGVTAGVCFGVPQVRNQIVGIYHDVENKVNDTDLKNQIADLQLKLDDLTDKYNVNLDSFNKLKSEKENLIKEIEKIKIDNELSLTEKEELINNLNLQLNEKDDEIENLSTQNSNYLLEISELESSISDLNSQIESKDALLDERLNEINDLNLQIAGLREQIEQASSILFDRVRPRHPYVQSQQPLFSYLYNKYIDAQVKINGVYYKKLGFVFEKREEDNFYNAYLVSYDNVDKTPNKIGLLSTDNGYWYSARTIEINNLSYTIYSFFVDFIDDDVDVWYDTGISVVTDFSSGNILCFGGNSFTDTSLKNISSL